jgi:hypothetical protein
MIKYMGKSTLKSNIFPFFKMSYSSAIINDILFIIKGKQTHYVE